MRPLSISYLEGARPSVPCVHSLGSPCIGTTGVGKVRPMGVRLRGEEWLRVPGPAIGWYEAFKRLCGYFLESFATAQMFSSKNSHHFLHPQCSAVCIQVDPFSGN